MYIEYSLVCRDHIPLVMKLSLDKLPAVVDDDNDVSPSAMYGNTVVCKCRCDNAVSRRLTPSVSIAGRQWCAPPQLSCTRIRAVLI